MLRIPVMQAGGVPIRAGSAILAVTQQKPSRGAMAKQVDVAEVIGTQPFGPFHVRIIVLCLLIQFLDGFDTQALAYAAPALRDAWGLGPRDLGPVFSWGAVGSGIGSICMGLMADMFGRKKIMIASVALFGVLSLCTVLVTSIEQLLILRP